jgi:ribosomal protein L37AE/L43A
MNKENVSNLCTAVFSGLCCPQCSMLSRRVARAVWKCINTNCSLKASGPFPKLSIAQLAQFDSDKVTDFTLLPRYVRMEARGHHLMHVYNLEEGCSVYYVLPKPEQNNAAARWAQGKLDQIAENANNGNLPFERRSPPSETKDALTIHFAINIGARHNYGIPMPTIPFEETIPDIRETVDRAQELAQLLAPPGTQPLNECYIGAYLQNGGMNWRDDGEERVGHMVGKLTLGGQGRMKLSMMQEVMRDKDSSGRVFPEDPVIPGCEKESERRALRERLEAGTLTKHDYDVACTSALRDVRNPNPRALPKTLLDFPVVHGRFCLMVGGNFQKYILHTVNVSSPGTPRRSDTSHQDS